MAIIFEHQSQCPICGKELNEKNQFLMFPHFISNIKDPLFLFSDSGVHLNCLNEHPLGVNALFFKEKHYVVIPSINSICHIDGKSIQDPRDIFVIGMLTSDKNENLFKFNFLVLNKKNLNKWKDKDEFIKAASEYKKQNKWSSLNSFNYLDYLINEVTNSTLMTKM